MADKKTKRNKHQRKDKRYEKKIIVGYKDDGKPKYKSIYADSSAELKRKANAFNAHKYFNGITEDNNILFGKYTEMWFEVKQSKSYNTKRMYEILMNNHIEYLKYKKVKSIDRTDIQVCINNVKDKPTTCQQLKMMLNQIFECAIDDNIILKNPVRKIEMPKVVKKPKRALYDDEWILSIESDFTDRERAYVYSLLFLGVRKEEALALTTDDFNFRKKILSVNKALIFIKNRPHLKDTKSYDSKRELPIPNECIKFFKYYISNLDQPNLMYNLTGGTMTSSGFEKMWEKIIAKMKAKARENGLNEDIQITSHIYRHNYCTSLYYAGYGIKDAQYLMGHADSQLTLDVYTHLDKKKNDDVKINTYFEEKIKIRQNSSNV